MNLNVIILAAGKGRRMVSAIPKVLHTLAGKYLLERVVNTAIKLKAKDVFVICGHQSDHIQETLSHLKVTWVTQEEQLGTGHAAAQALPHLKNDSVTLILFGDVPLISPNTLQTLVKATPKQGVALLVGHVDDPTGLGRIIRDENNILHKIVEEKDATPEQKQIKEVYTGIMAVDTGNLKNWLQRIDNDNAQGEYYLTEIPALAIADGCSVATVNTTCIEEVQGVNDKKQLAYLERYYHRSYAEQLMDQGLIVRDPHRIDIRGEMSIGEDVEVDVNVIFEGDVALGDNTRIGANTIIRNCKIGKNVIIKDNCILEDSVIEDDCIVGPFARIRPETHLAKEAHVGNFVEIKKSKIGKGSKVNHLSYVGDSEVGHSVNIGAGVITCNYDGVNKNKTIIGNNVHVGSDCQLVAPVTIGDNATIGAGATIVKDAPADNLTLCKIDQVTIDGWERPKKKDTE